jgi:hypothetical protein
MAAITLVSKASRRFHRTIVIGLVAMGVLIWAAIDQFGISRQEMAELFLGVLWIAVGTIIFAAVFTGLWVGLRKWMQRGKVD